MIELLKQVAPEVKIVVGGPEVSFADDLPALAEQVDYIITGPGEISFRQLCQDLLDGKPMASTVPRCSAV